VSDLPSKEPTIQEVLLEQEQAYMYSDKSLDSQYLLAVIHILQKEKGELELRFSKGISQRALLEKRFDHVYIKLITRGYQYCIEAALEILDDSRFNLKIVIKVEKQRLRKFFRVDAEMDFTVAKVDIHGIIGDAVKLTDLKYVNVSGGGIFFYCAELLMANLKLSIMLDLDGEIITVMGRVIRCSSIPDRGSMYGIATEFIGLSDRHRDKILNYVSNIQRRHLCSGVYAESKQSY
jgi:hypothetical protein